MVAKLLVANRGEIARRIFRTCREMGIATVAVHSGPDTGEPHAREADEAVLLPGETPGETYLDIDAVVSAAKTTSADAVHPGYGFLAENATFARAVISSGLTWIGPSPEAIEIMGSKLESKRLVEEAGVPTLPSIELAGLDVVNTAAHSLGYPLLVKASAGGGGKGMRIVSNPDDLGEAVESARREAGGAFGDDTVFLEKYLDAARHIEMQVIGDNWGTILSLHERECSIQRRHQKIIEEAPSPALEFPARLALGEAAVKVASGVDYVGAGTVEFLYQDGRFYFLEMNTRIQVEHPVTEMVTGLDLVRLQIEIARGERLPDKGPRIQGHAIEARLYAEDPLNDYLPSPGVFHRFDFPDAKGLRVDAGIEAGSEVTVHYDPMIAKVIAHAATREMATTTLANALRRAHIHGSTTNRALLVRILEHPEFASAETDTQFLMRTDPVQLGKPLIDVRGERLSALAAALSDQARERGSTPVLTTIPSGWRNSPSQTQVRSYRGGHDLHEIQYSMQTPFKLEGLGTVTVEHASATRVAVLVGDVEHDFQVARYGELRYVDSSLGPARLLEIPRFAASDAEEDAGSLHAPMPGRVIRVDAVEGADVREGTVLVVIEAMKMEHTLRAPHDGRVSSVLCRAGDQVDANRTLVVVEQP